MVKPYYETEHLPDAVRPATRSVYPGGKVNETMSREIVPPSYRYGTPGYMPDGRGGRGYDFGYPGYRDQGGGGYPHAREFGAPRPR
jgi:hypothetical protein